MLSHEVCPKIYTCKGTRPSSSPVYLSCPWESGQTQEDGVDTMDASAAVPTAALDRWLLEEALATLSPVCLLIRSASERAWNILVRQSLSLSPGRTRMRAGEHMQQTGCQSLSPSDLTQRRPPWDVSVNSDGSLYHCFLRYIVCETDASSGWTAASEEQGEAAACQR